MMLQVLRRHFRIPAQDRDIIHAFTGVRPLYDENAENPSAVTRKYVLEIDGTPEVPPPLLIAPVNGVAQSRPQAPQMRASGPGCATPLTGAMSSGGGTSG